MLEKGHRDALGFVAKRALEAAGTADTETLRTLNSQMAAIIELDEKRVEILKKHGVPDVGSDGMVEPKKRRKKT